MNRTYLISVRWVTSPVNTALMDGVVSIAGDWIRFNAFTWFLSTSRSPVEIRALLTKHLETEDSFLIVPVDMRGADGWAPGWIWQWFVEKSGSGGLAPTEPRGLLSDYLSEPKP